MRISSRAARPCNLACAKNPTTSLSQPCKISLRPKTTSHKNSIQINPKKTLTHFLNPLENRTPSSNCTGRLRSRWMEYQGARNWDGLLDPLDDNLRREILRYGNFVDAAYKACDFDPSSPTYATRRFSKSSLFERCGMPNTGYRVTKNLRATSGIKLPTWTENGPSWAAARSSWIGYVAVCQDKEEIRRLGRRDIVVAYRGTATCLEWLENLRAKLTHLPTLNGKNNIEGGPMVESGFLSLYTSRSETFSSLQQMVREEISRLLEVYKDEPLSLTITGHSLGAALATLTAYDVQKSFGPRAPLVTVMSFGGPRVGNRAFRCQLERQGARVLRIVNSDDVITKVPGFTIEDSDDVARKDNNNNNNKYVVHVADLPKWIRRRVADTKWVYAEVGEELRICSRNSPYLKGTDFATCHDLKTYLHLVNGFVSSTCPFKATAKNILNHHFRPDRESRHDAIVF